MAANYLFQMKFLKISFYGYMMNLHLNFGDSINNSLPVLKVV